MVFLYSVIFRSLLLYSEYTSRAFEKPMFEAGSKGSTHS